MVKCVFILDAVYIVFPLLILQSFVHNVIQDKHMNHHTFTTKAQRTNQNSKQKLATSAERGKTRVARSRLDLVVTSDWLGK